MALQYHLKIDSGDVAPYVLLPGDSRRVGTIASFRDQAHHVATNCEHVTHTGTYEGAPISCTSFWLGSGDCERAVLRSS